MKIFLISLVLITIIFKTKAADIQSTQLKLQSQIENVVWCGNDRIQDEDDETIVLDGFESRITDILFMQTFNGEVYISNNHGQQWANFTDSIVKQFGTKIKTKNFKINMIKVSPADTQMIFLFGSNGESFVSQNCGKKLALITHDKNLHDFKLNRMNKNLLLAHKSVSCKKFDEECDVGERSLYLSKDMGRTFNQIVEHVNFGMWDKNNHEDEVHNHRILVHQRIQIKGKNNDKQVLRFSDDFFETFSQIDDNVQHYFQTPHYLFVLTDSEQPDSYNLKVAPKESNDYLQYKTRDINLPIKRNKDHSFTVLDTNEGQVFIGINHQGHSSLMTNIYYSDVQGQNYTLGLLNAVRDEQGNVDYEKIQSNDGTYIANIYDKEELDRLQNTKQGKQQQNQEKSYSKKGGYQETKNFNSQYNSMQSIKKSKISFNRGSTWHPIKSPKKTFDKQEIRCSGECSLHLVGRTEVKGQPLYSSKNAHGIILATGNTGLYLEEKEENMNTYLSNDGGHIWYEIKKHPHIYEIGDRGGIIVLARSNAVTNQVHYSWNLGQDWTSYKFAEKPMTVVNIMAEQSNMGQKFLIFGRKQSKTDNKVDGIVISIDFSSLHQRVCELEYDPENSESDYEFWTPKNFDFDECLFGQKTRYVRRKQSAQCYNPVSNDEYQFVDSCSCTEEDFECDFGFYRNDDNQCVPMNQKYALQEDYPAPQACNNFYYVPTGYKKISISKCKGGTDLGPIKKQCPAKEAKQSSTTKLIEEDETNQNKASNNNNNNKLEGENHNGFLQKYGYIIIILGLIYYFKDTLYEYISQIVSYGAQFIPGNGNSQQMKGYGSLDGQSGENLGLVEGDEEEQN